MTDDLSEPESAATPWTRRSPAVWSAARADYLAGGTAAEVCERHGLSLSTFRWRARTEGWRLADQPHGEVFVPMDDENIRFQDAGLPCNASDMARLAWSNASQAMRDGKLIEARGWTRLHNDLVVMSEADRKMLSIYAYWASKPDLAHQVPKVPPLRPMEEE